MKAFFLPVVVSLVVQAMGSLGGAFYCRALEARLAACCCPSDEETPAGPQLVGAGCCDVLQAMAGASDPQQDPGTLTRAPARTALAVEVAPPAAVATGLHLVRAELVQNGSGPPPGQAPVFLVQRALLI